LSLVDRVEYTFAVLLAVTTIPAALVLDYEVEVPLPDDLASRAAILRFHAKTMRVLVRSRKPT
jgi:hypothetical protein